MEIGLLLIFWYGILHAFGPDHLTAIVDFSIGKSKKKTLFITLAFAIGHGVMLFAFAKILQTFDISEEILGYGDLISSSVIILMGVFLLYMVASKRIILTKHTHEGKEHIHISYSKNHKHNSNDTVSAFSIGALMGIGGVRGMLVTLGVIGSQNVDFSLVLAFVAGVSLVFISFGYLINYMNETILSTQKNVNRAFGVVGVLSILVGTNMLLG
jgi:ABC-type nickel/cobalt efflux system permease component RcnA